MRVPASYRIISRRFPINGMLDFAKGGSFLSSREALEFTKDRRKTAKRRVARAKTPLLPFQATISDSCNILVTMRNPESQR